MRVPSMESLAQDLAACLAAGPLACSGHVELSDGAIVDFERMARIVLFDVERMARMTVGDGRVADEAQAIYDDLRRLLSLAQTPV
jgi:hypothetical protein